MKKLLFSLVLLGTISNAQILQQENFDGLTTATIVGQSSPAYAKLNGVNTDYMVATGTTGKQLNITGSNTTGTGTARFLWKDGLDAAWATRTVGNNIIQIEYDYFTGPTTVSNNGGGLELYDVTYNIYLGGLTMLQSSKTILGLMMDPLDPTSVTTINLGAGSPAAAVNLPANTWVRLGFAYNTVTGALTYKGPGFNKTVTNVINVPFEFDYAVQNLLNTNTASSVNSFDNVIVRAVATEGLFLQTSDVIVGNVDFTIFPNPAIDFINVNSKVKILAAYIYDMSGIRIDARIVDGKIDVKNLQAGTYLLGLKTDKGLVTKQFIRK